MNKHIFFLDLQINKSKLCVYFMHFFSTYWGYTRVCVCVCISQIHPTILPLPNSMHILAEGPPNEVPSQNNYQI